MSMRRLIAVIAGNCTHPSWNGCGWFVWLISLTSLILHSDLQPVSLSSDPFYIKHRNHTALSLLWFSPYFRSDQRKARARVHGSNYKECLTVIGSGPNQPASLGVFMGFMSALVRAVSLPFYQKYIQQILKLFQVPSVPNNIPDQESTSGEDICEWFWESLLMEM